MRLNQITVPVSNIDHSIAFYKTLGLNLIVHSNDRYARFVCPDGDSSFSIHLSNNLSSGGGVWVYFEIDDLDEFVRELRSKGVHMETEPTDQPWHWREARLKDPDGNQLILYKAGDNRLNPPWRLKNS